MTKAADSEIRTPATMFEKKARWGKWTKEEEAYTARLIGDFTAGILTDIDNGTTMRSWLSTKLRCCPMRISKKFVGEHSIGKRMFERNEARMNEMTEEQKAKNKAEVDILHAEFCESWIREEQERHENKLNGTRKRKRNKQPKKDFKPSIMVTLSSTKVVPTLSRYSPLTAQVKSSFLPRPPALHINETTKKIVHKAQSPIPSTKKPSHMNLPSKIQIVQKKITPEVQLSFVSRSRSLSVELSDFNGMKDKIDPDSNDFAFDSRDFDFINDNWIEPMNMIDEDLLVPLDTITQTAYGVQIKVEDENSSNLGDLLSPTSVIDFTSPSEPLWPPQIFTAPLLYDPLF